MKNFIKKFCTLVLSVAVLLTSGVFIPNVSAATFKPIVEHSEWVSSDTVKVHFSEPILLATDGKAKIAMSKYGEDITLTDADEVSIDGKDLFIRLASGYNGSYSGLKFKKGSITSKNGEPTTEDISAFSIKLDKAITSLSIDDNKIPAAGKNVEVKAVGKNLDFGNPISLKVYAGGTATDIKATLVAANGTSGVIKLTIPENTKNETVTYKIKKQKGYTFSYEDVDPSFTLIQDAKDGTTTPGGGGSGTTPTETKVNSISYDKTSFDSKGGKVTAEIIGKGFSQPNALSAKVYKANTAGMMTDSLLPTQVNVVDDTHARVTFTLPANEGTSNAAYTLRVAINGSDNYSAVMDANNHEQIVTVAQKAGGGSSEPSPIPDGAKTFALDIDDWAIYNMGDGLFDVVFKKPVTINDKIDINKMIYFSNRSDKTVPLTADDKVSISGNVLTIQLADKTKNIPSYLFIKEGALKNQEGAYLQYKMSANHEHFHYITEGAHVDSMTFNKITFSSKGGHLVATIKGHKLKDIQPNLSPFNVTFAKNDGTINDVTPYNLKVDVKSNNEAVVTADLPANTTDRTESYRIVPVLYGRQLFTTYIEGYDIVSVLPVNKTEDETTLSSVMISGANDTDPALDVYDVDVKSHNVSLKINAVLRGTNLSAKKTKVKIVDENGTEWPAKPVYECGATYRWQQSNMFLPDIPSKNEQHVELLVPRALGMDHKFTLTFAPDGKNFDENLKATVIVRNDGIIDTSNSAFNMDDYTKLRTITVKYVDKEGNQLAEPKKVKVYGILELYALGLKAKDINGYKLVNSDPNKDLLDAMLATPEEREDGKLSGATVFVKAFPYDTITYTYEKTATPTPDPGVDPEPSQTGYHFVIGNNTVWKSGDLRLKIENADVDKNTAGDKVFDRFLGIEIDGKLVDKSNYIVKSGSVDITLKESFVRTLGAGRHSVKANFRGGESATTYFTVVKGGAAQSGINKGGTSYNKAVKTGDSSNAFADVLALLLSGSALAGVAAYRRKRA